MLHGCNWYALLAEHGLVQQEQGRGVALIVLLEAQERVGGRLHSVAVGKFSQSMNQGNQCIIFPDPSTTQSKVV